MVAPQINHLQQFVTLQTNQFVQMVTLQMQLSEVRVSR